MKIKKMAKMILSAALCAAMIIPGSANVYAGEISEEFDEENIEILAEDSSDELMGSSLGENYTELSDEECIKNFVDEEMLGDVVDYTLDNGVLTVNSGAPDYNSWGSLNKSAVKRVIISEGVTTIGSAAFKEFSNLEEISISKSVSNIVGYMCGKCPKLKTITVHAENPTYYSDNNAVLKQDGKTLVSACSSTTTIPAGVTAIPQGVFYLCEGLKSITINENVNNIASHAFDYTSDLEEVSINGGSTEYTSICSEAFHFDVDKSKLKKVTLSGKLQLGSNIFENAPLTELTLPSDWKYAEDFSKPFTGLYNLKKITNASSSTPIYFNKSVDHSLNPIGNRTYKWYSDPGKQHEITTLVSGTAYREDYGDNPYIHDNDFWSFNEETGLLFIKDINKTGATSNQASAWKHSYAKKVKKAIVEEGISNVYTWFQDCTNMKEITLPNTLTSVTDAAFSGCTCLEQVTIPASLGKNGEYSSPTAFRNCTGLKRIDNNANFRFQFDVISPGKKWYDMNNYGEPLTIADGVGVYIREDYVDTNNQIKKKKIAPTKTPEKEIDPESLDPTKRFKDVNPGRWYSKEGGPITYVVENGIMAGIGDGTKFGPEDPCTRSQFVQILYNVSGTDDVEIDNPFSDVGKKWYTNAVIWALGHNVTGGTSPTTFGPDITVTREQVAQFLMNYAKDSKLDTTKRADLSKFPDGSEVSGWAYEAMSWANSEGIINGYGNGKLGPKDDCQRAQIAQMVMKFIQVKVRNY